MSFIPKIKLAIKMIGKINQPRKIRRPAKIRKISAEIPMIIKKTLSVAPKIRENKLERKTSKYFPISNPRGWAQLYLRQGEKRVLINKGREK